MFLPKNKLKNRLLHFARLCFAGTLLPLPVLAEDARQGFKAPLWEAGLVAAAFSGPAYPAANDETTAAFASPFVIYRGPVFSVGDEGALRALAFANDTVELDLSLGASLPADSEDDADREGMPDLDFLFEIGPQLIWHAAQHDFKRWRGEFDIKLRARSVISFADFDTHGFLFEPTFVYELKSKTRRHLSWQADVELLYGNKRLNRYFYNVAPPYVTDNRGSYLADNGYMGAEIGVGLSYPVDDNLRLFVGGNVELYDGAANQDSPLFKEDVAYSGGLVLVYSFYESEARAPR
ncbi:MAG: MipA/OmpV family protein [PS1 clade bacterium]|nr:MipA/OmpV family protein [PS1 clade bacterium]